MFITTYQVFSSALVRTVFVIRTTRFSHPHQCVPSHRLESTASEYRSRYWRRWELLAFEYVKINVDNEFWKIKSMQYALVDSNWNITLCLEIWLAMYASEVATWRADTSVPPSPDQTIATEEHSGQCPPNFFCAPQIFLFPGKFVLKI